MVALPTSDSLYKYGTTLGLAVLISSGSLLVNSASAFWDRLSAADLEVRLMVNSMAYSSVRLKEYFETYPDLDQVVGPVVSVVQGPGLRRNRLPHRAATRRTPSETQATIATTTGLGTRAPSRAARDLPRRR